MSSTSKANSRITQDQEVDAVVISTDKWHEHVERCRPFIEAGLPIFVDKPLVDNARDLVVFRTWLREGHNIMSSSCMRYAKEFAPYRASCCELGSLRFLSITTSKKWETYGIHALEAMYPIVEPGFISARNTGSFDRNVVHLKHADGLYVVVIASKDMYGGFGLMTLAGAKCSRPRRTSDLWTSVTLKRVLTSFPERCYAYSTHIIAGKIT